MPDENGVTITRREIYDLAVEVRDQARQNAITIDTLNRRTESLKNDVRELRDDTRRRFDALNLKVYALIAGLVGTLAVFVKAAFPDAPLPL